MHSEWSNSLNAFGNLHIVQLFEITRCQFQFLLSFLERETERNRASKFLQQIRSIPDNKSTHLWKHYNKMERFKWHSLVVSEFREFENDTRKYTLTRLSEGPDESVGIVTRKRPTYRASIVANEIMFLFSITSRPAIGFIQPSTQWAQRTLSMGVKLPGRQTDHTPLSAEVDLWNYTSISPLRLHGLVPN
jgi:hypothetical protein